MILVDEKLVLKISFKIPKSLALSLYDFSLKKSDCYEINTVIEESTYIIIRMGKDILRAERQNDIESKSMEKLLFRIKRDSDFNYLLENPSAINISEYNAESLNDKLWYTINSNSNSDKSLFINKEDYFICQYDIIKFGNIKYIVKEITIENVPKEINFEFYPSIQTYYFSKNNDENGKEIICEICNKSECNEDNPIVKFCSCNYIHYECLKTKIEINSYKKEKEKVSNYYINNLKCKTCDFIFPLRFKLANKKFELINIEIPSEENTKYIILESIEKKIFYGYMKLIHVIQFDKNEDIINIGRNKTINDMVICDPSISKEHAQFIYQENTGKILLKNLSKKFGSSVFIKNAINIGDKRMQIQIGKILFETQRMKFGEFDKNRKRRKTKYPLPSKY
jgi:hypothetical protein